MTAPRRVAIIGLGPCGLGALEALLAQIEGGAWEIDLYDPHPHPGAGPNFSPDQSPLMLLNLPQRLIDLPSPLPGVAPLSASATADAGPDRFPPRSEIGGELEARWRAVVAAAPAGVTITRHARRIERICAKAGGWRLGEEPRPHHEALLALGQPRAAPDAQLARWRDHADAGHGALLPAYPAAAVLEAAPGWRGKRVAIRGFGLSTLDMLRLLTIGRGGRFDGGRYHRSGDEPSRILPFSLDGRPPAPKPVDAALDASFDPSSAETDAFSEALTEALALPPEAALARICAAVEPAAARLAGRDPAAWLAAERRQPGAAETLEAVAFLRETLAIAHGERAPGPGYAVGALWRKWQPVLRARFAAARPGPETAAAIIRFDEGLKRYSYGPPAQAAEELLMLIEDGLVAPQLADDPDIALIDSGWRLREDGDEAVAQVMIDAVLPGPALEGIAAPVIASLRAQGHLSAVGEKLGARTCADGRAIGADGAPRAGLCLLGRLTHGSEIGLDSLGFGFGEAGTRWAKGVVGRSV